MKILHYINNLASGGAEKLLSSILQLMQEKGHTVCLVISNNRKSIKEYEQTIVDSGIKIINLEQSFYNPLQVIQLIFLIRKEKFDIIHAHLFPSQYWLAVTSFFKPYKTKLIKTEHSVFNERKKYLILKPLEKLIYRRYSKIICITEQVKINLAKWLHAESNLSVIHNGINLKQFKIEAKNSIHPNGLFDKSNTNILMCARFDSISKDHKTIVNALKQLPTNFKLFFAGEGPDMNKVKEYVELQNLDSRVCFLGYRPDISYLMGSADINVLSTHFEGLSGVTLEALASGKPFLGSNVTGVNTIVPNESFLFEKGNPTELAHKIKIISNNSALNEKMSIEANVFIQQFDIHKMVDQYLKLYQETLC
jgi:glycosyltransferase involved in cell wall biosynthesis